MFFVSALARKALSNPRSVQREPDIWKLYHLLHYFQQCGGKEVGIPRPKDVSFAKQYRAVYSAVTEQVLRNLELLAKVADPSCNSAAVPSHNNKEKGSDCPEVITRAKLLRIKALPFQLSIPDIPHPNNPIPGVRLEGHAVPGTVLCFFPGTVYLPPCLRHMSNFPNISQGNPYLMARTDSSVIDASCYKMEEVQRNPYAVGHLVRHPSKGQQPNIMPFSYDVDPQFPEELLSLIPNKYFRKPGFLYSSGSPMRSLVFVAMTHIKDEELLLNYRLHPDSQLPDWYTSLDKEEDRRRWQHPL